jgi:hypothetical protein
MESLYSLLLLCMNNCKVTVVITFFREILSIVYRVNYRKCKTGHRNYIIAGRRAAAKSGRQTGSDVRVSDRFRFISPGALDVRYSIIPR